jgi:hypothetical protein
MPKVASTAAARVLPRGTNSFTSARAAVFNPLRGLERGRGLFVSSFSAFPQ